MVAAARGRVSEAREVLEELTARRQRRYVSPVALVMLHATLGDQDGALAWLDRAFEERRGWLAYLNVEPTLDGLRGDPRFRRLLERMRLA
jgi:predicted nucleic acid-binding protein